MYIIKYTYRVLFAMLKWLQNYIGGSLKFKNGDTYDGEYINSIPHGIGTLTTKKNNKFMGIFSNGIIIIGSCNYQNGDFYIGQFNGKCKNGLGSYYKDDKIYFGKFIDDSFSDGIIICSKEQTIYEGKVIDYKFNGCGMLFSNNAIINGEFCDGCIESGNIIKINGEEFDGIFDCTTPDIFSYKKGILKKNNVIYDGNFIFNKFVFGKILFSDKSEFNGNYDEDTKICVGVYKFDNKIYDGQMVNFIMNGKGTLFCLGNKYDGIFEMGQFISGKITTTNNDQFEGIVDNIKNKQIGIYRYSNGDVFDGEMQNFRRHGIGKLKCKDKMYYGQFQNDLYCGRGIMKWENGAMYDGEFDKNRNGYGIYINVVYIYEGYWKNGKRNGYGICRLNNKILIGEWENDEFILGEKINLNTTDNTIVTEKGNFKCEEITNGEKIYLNGYIYDGDWNNNNFIRGTIKIFSKILFEGHTFMGGWNGTYNNINSVYQGEMDINFIPNGKGVNKYNNGDIHIGTWKNGNLDGFSQILFNDGNTFNGEFLPQFEERIGIYYCKAQDLKYFQYIKSGIIYKMIQWDYDEYKMCDLHLQNHTDNFMCPISQDIMLEPIITSCGHKFDKSEMIKYFKTKRKMECPLCRGNIESYYDDIDTIRLIEKNIFLNNKKISREHAIIMKNFMNID
jgi:hypothetical protein